MIPKIIHYCWFSGNAFPAKVQECIDSWHRYMPDWEFRLWDAESIQSIDSVWLKECLLVKKWAFAADFVRLYALYIFGGIYLDTDCLVYRSFEPLLSHQSFIGQEWYIHIDCFTTHHYLTSHCMGAESGHPFVGRCLRYYDDRHFIRTQQSDLPDHLRFDQTLLPEIQKVIAQQYFGYDPRPSMAEGYPKNLPMVGQDNSTLTIYPFAYFDCYEKQQETFCRHLALGGWADIPQSTEPKVSLSYRIKYHLELWLHRWMEQMGYILTKKQ